MRENKRAEIEKYIRAYLRKKYYNLIRTQNKCKVKSRSYSLTCSWEIMESLKCLIKRYGLGFIQQTNGHSLRVFEREKHDEVVLDEM